MDDTLQRKTHNAFASLCVSIKAILTASSRTRREVFFFRSIAEWHKHEAHHLTIAPQVNVRTNGANGNDKE